MSEPTPFLPAERLHSLPFAVPRDLIELARPGDGHRHAARRGVIGRALRVGEWAEAKEAGE